MSSRKCKGCGEFFSVKLEDCPACGTKYETEKSSARVHGSKGDYTTEVYNKTPACAMAGCQEKGACAIHTKTGWANFCVSHYNSYWQTPDFKEKLDAHAARRRW